VAEKVLEIKD